MSRNHIIHSRREVGPIFLSRGLHQGDPLSPYLFILYVVGLPALLRRYENQKWIEGIKFNRKAPSIPNMLFADDSYLYCKTSENETLKILNLLHTKLL